MSRGQAEELTRGLLSSLGLASSPEALTACVEALNEHLIRHPSCKAVIWQVCFIIQYHHLLAFDKLVSLIKVNVRFQEKTAATLLRQRRTYRHDEGLQAALRETLALIGYVDPVKGRGIRVLSIDGGGTR